MKQNLFNIDYNKSANLYSSCYLKCKKSIDQKLYLKKEIDILLKYDLHLKDLDIGRMIEKIISLKKNAEN
jgi:hypothetical protein|tara:strand:+ start:299 stop:508 length:210 start_codon:yes stop_codon:yes gene_type:complete